MVRFARCTAAPQVISGLIAASSWPQRLALISLLVLVACSGNPPRAPTDLANKVLFRALGLVGTPYHWGGNSPQTGFDCSGLVRYVYQQDAGIALPRTSRAMSEIDAPRVERDQLASGDLLFFHGNDRGVSHVAIYVGNGRFVHAPNSGGEVRLDRLDNPYWSEHFMYGSRPLTR